MPCRPLAGGAYGGAVLAAALLVAAAPPAHAAAPNPPPEAAPPHRAASIATGAHPDAVAPPRAGISPPDGVWLVAADGRQYYLDALPKEPGTFRWFNDHEVSYLGNRLEVDHADDANLYIRIYRLQATSRQGAGGGTGDAAKGPAADPGAAAPGLDRLRFSPFGAPLPVDLTASLADPGLALRPTSPGAVTIVDADHDRRPDLLVGGASTGPAARSRLYLGQPGEGWKLAPPEALSADLQGADLSPVLDAGSRLRGATVADFDHDGLADIAIGYAHFADGAWQSRVELFLARQDGRWEDRRILAEPGAMAVEALASGDLDGDGQADLVVSDHDGTIRVFLGDGHGGLLEEAAPELRRAHEGCAGKRLRLADLDGDGRAELVGAFSGEANATYDPQRCLDRGGLFAWRATLAH